MEQLSKGTTYLGKNPSTWLSKIYSLIWNRHSLPVCAMSIIFIGTDLGVQKSNGLNFPITKSNVYFNLSCLLYIENLVNYN